MLLPIRFNDGKRIPKELFADALLELEAKFGAVSSETQIIHGSWRYKGKSFRDDLVRIYVDAADTKMNRRFFVAFKERLKARFRQLDIWMTTYLVELI